MSVLGLQYTPRTRGFITKAMEAKRPNVAVIRGDQGPGNPPSDPTVPGIADILRAESNVRYIEPDQAPAVAATGGLDAVLIPADQLQTASRAIAAAFVAQAAAGGTGTGSGSAGGLGEGTRGGAGSRADIEGRGILESIGGGVCIADGAGSVHWANERFRSYDEQLRARIAQACRLAAGMFEEELAEPGRPGGHESAKFEVGSPDGQRFFEVLVSRVPASSAADLVAGRDVTGVLVVGIVWDVTGSRRMQNKMDAIDRAGAELVRLDAESIRKMHAGERLTLLEDKIIRFSHDLLNFDHFSIRLLDEKSGRLELLMASGLPPEAADADVLVSREGNGIVGYVAATGRSYLCPDVRRDKRYRSGMRGAASSLTVPLRLHDRVIGVFNVESDEQNAFTEEDRQFAEMFANHVALAVHILDLLVVERCHTGENVTGLVEGELTEPLEDIVAEADELKRMAGADPEVKRHLERILEDVSAIRQRVRDAATGPQRIIGTERELRKQANDPLVRGIRVLVADDEVKIRRAIRDVLVHRGAAVVVCENGGEAIEALERTSLGGSGDARPFDLVISDIRMPDRNGYEVFAAARRTGNDPPIILMTGFGYDPHHSIVRASQEGLQCVLFKPFQIERLIEEIHKALNRSPA